MGFGSCLKVVLISASTLDMGQTTKNKHIKGCCFIFVFIGPGLEDLMQ